jgi:4'-phosphopantetheinyl transferase
MPVCKLETSGNDCFWGIWKMDEKEAVLLHSLGDFPMPQTLHSIVHEKKRLEWLSSRLLIRQLMKNNDENFYGIINDANGKPHLHNSKYHLSLSHGGEYTVAIIHKKYKVGIDIELIREKIRLVSGKFLSAAEAGHLGNDLEKLCVSWCVKEVLYKIHSIRNISLKNNIYLHPFDFNNDGGFCSATLYWNGHNEDFKVRYFRLENYFIVYNVYGQVF